MKKKFYKILLFRHLFSFFMNMLLRINYSSRIYKFNHQTILETFWTLVPIFIILSIAIPSFVLLYAVDVMSDSTIGIKIIGHQWFWNYECDFPSNIFTLLENNNFTLLENNKIISNDFKNMIEFKQAKFDSYMVYEKDLLFGEFRLLEVDNPLLIPYKLHINLVITSTDVIHSWAVPSIGVKVDAVPGRLNHISLFLERRGIFYGQCSELCGVNHGFMPIKLVSVSYPEYVSYCYNIFYS